MFASLNANHICGVWCWGGWVARYHIDTYACCHVAKRPKLVIKTGGSTQLDWRARRSLSLAEQKPLSSLPARTFSYLSDLEPVLWSTSHLISLVELVGEGALARLGSDLNPNQF